MIAGFIVDVEFIWGFQASVVGLSKTNPPFLYPPPTTFLGAIAEAVSKDLGLGESTSRRIMAEVAKNLLAIGLKPINCMPVKYSDINRIIAVKVTSGRLHPIPMNITGSFDAPARGKTVLQSLDDAPPVIRWFIVFGSDELAIKGHNLRLENVIWKIHRLGSKESRVCIIDVKKTFDVKSSCEEVKTNYSIPLSLVGPVDLSEITGKWVIEQYLNPFDEKSFEKPVEEYMKGTVKFMIPICDGYERPSAKVRPLENAMVYSCGEEVVIGRGYKS